MIEDREEEFECPCSCENCGKVVELEDLWPDPNESDNGFGRQDLRYCRTCYEEMSL